MTATTQFKSRLLSGLSAGLSHVRRLATSNTANISILAGLTFIPFTLAVTAAVDLSNAIRIKASLQAAADAGVLAAATALASGYGDGDKTKIAEDTFYANLSPELLSAFPTAPNVTIDFANQTVHMDVDVNTDQLLTSLITDSMALHVESTAVADQGNPVCLMALNPTAWKSLNIQGTADVQALACAVQVNSNHTEAMRQTGTSAAAAEGFCVHGNYSGTNYTPKPRRHCMREQDPLAAQFAIDLAATDLTKCRPDNPQLVKDNIEHVNLAAGVYCGGLRLEKGKIRLQDGGIYVFRDGEFFVSAGSWVEGNNVAIVLTGNDQTFVNIRAQANMNISARPSGRFAGIVISQDPASIPAKVNEIIGGGYMKMDGIVYFPQQPLKITGNGEIGTDASQFAIVADTITIEGNGLLTIKIGADYMGAGLPALPQSNEVIRLVH